MALSDTDKSGVERLLDESTLIGLEFDLENCRAGLTLAVLLAPEERELRVLMVLRQLKRVVAYQAGLLERDDEELTLERVPTVLRRLATLRGGHAMAGLAVLDRDVRRPPISDWWDGRQLDRTLRDDVEASHSIYLFDEYDPRGGSLDLMFWFDDLDFYDPSGDRLSLDRLVARSDEWWRSWHEGPRLRRGADTWVMKPIPLPSGPSGQAGSAA